MLWPHVKETWSMNSTIYYHCQAGKYHARPPAQLPQLSWCARWFSSDLACDPQYFLYCIVYTRKMSSTRRSTKRSVLGIQVAAKRDTGYYDSATLVDVTNKQVAGASFPSTNGCTGDKFLLKFEDATTQWYLERHIIGQGKNARDDRVTILRVGNFGPLFWSLRRCWPTCFQKEKFLAFPSWVTSVLND